LGRGIPPDPLWSIFDHLCGPDAGPAPALSDLILRSRAWLEDAGFAADDIPGLLRQPARLFVTRTHVDLIFRLDQIDLRARLAGLDRDPGWVPALGHVISFQYR
jgi:hypothetical protein